MFIAGLYLLLLVSTVAWTAIVPLLPRIGRLYDLSSSDIALVLALPSVAAFAVSMPASIFAERFGVRGITLAAAGAMCGATAAQAIPSYVALLAARSVFGLAYGVLWTAGVAWVSSLYPERGSPRLGKVATCGALGNIGGPAFGGLLGELLGTAAPFWILSAVSLVLVLALWRGSAAATAAAVDRELVDWRTAVASFVGHLPRQTGLLAGACGLAILGAVIAVAQLMVPLQLHRVGFSGSEIGGVFSAGAILYIIANMVIVGFGRRLMTVRYALAGALAMACGLLPAAFDSGAVAVIGGLMLVMVPRAMVATVAYPLVTKATPGEEFGEVLPLGLLNATWALGSLTAPLIAGVFNQLSGPAAAYLIVIVPCAACALWLLFRRTSVSVKPVPKHV